MTFKEKVHLKMKNVSFQTDFLMLNTKGGMFWSLFFHILQ